MGQIQSCLSHEDDVSVRTADGRDEMNLAEFPLSCLADRAPKGQKTLEFQDRVWDRGRREYVVRRLTISASDKYGLPTALDDEVVLGLIQITRSAAFRSRRVAFSRYQLLQILGWRDEGKSYRRLEQSLKRWLGVTLYYDRAWWDKRRQLWVDENFHILDRVVMDRRAGSRRGTGTQQCELPLSFFVWNEVVFRSFQAGNLKALDMEIYRQLKRPVAKRMYRFLDKRFYRRREVILKLSRFAREHIGLSRCYDAGQLKRRLNLAIDELVNIGFLEPMDNESRYRRIQRGQWEVVFRKKKGRSRKCPTKQVGGTLEAELVARGVSAKAANRLAERTSVDRIQEKIELFDWHAGRNERKSPGWLRKAIEEDYTPPPGFETRQERIAREKARAEAERKAFKEKRAQRERNESAASRRREAVDAFLDSLPDSEREACERAAWQSAPAFTRRYYEDLKTAGRSDSIAESVYRQIVEDYVIGLIKQQRQSATSKSPETL